MFSLNCKGRLYSFAHPLVMGIVNTTPDSFFAGSRKNSIDAVLFRVEQMVRDGRLLHTYKDGRARIEGFLEDYALYAEGLLQLYRATWEVRWLQQARTWAEHMLDHFWDDEGGGFFQTGDQHEALITRPKDLFDEAVPSGNGVAADVLLRLAALVGEPEYDRRARATIELVAPALTQYPTALGSMLNALDLALAEPQEVAIVGDPAAADTRAMIEALDTRYLPRIAVAVAALGDTAAVEAVPLLRDRPQREGKATAYVCRSFVCRAPTTDVKEMMEEIAGR